MFILLLVLVVLVSGFEEYSEEDLEAMTKSELESICETRGFKLVNNAEDLTKQDYVEAAQRCLAIEQEMNELLTQYPELADELEEEIKKMEKENAEKKAYIDELENELASESSDDDQDGPGMAFVPPSKSRGSEDVVDEVETERPIVEETIDADEDLDPATSVETIESQQSSPTKEDLTLTHIAVESLRVLVKNAQDDVKRIINLAIPVLQPLFNVGDAAWRQLKTLFVRAREVYEAYQVTNMPSSEGTPETCDNDV